MIISHVFFLCVWSVNSLIILCFTCSLALVMFKGKALLLYIGLGLPGMKDSVRARFQAENTQYISIKALLKISMLVLSLTLTTFSLKVDT